MATPPNPGHTNVSTGPGQLHAATDVDLMTTYVGGTRECVAAVVADEGLEAMEITVDQSGSKRSHVVRPSS
ncbi:hypothetical protein Plo01_48110 [Planobispora longispora]|uniref:Uncharacterized protein n=1 Tax=Planobispora longispora TaxID=28887 RepID=A0A8J3RMH9_9ACTN|nr:hypothetical protein GCM10020093_064580 [Planobispora longispora]GIH78382.1 hypothetical protein Plo01_48110 [Planobispora longispora]